MCIYSFGAVEYSGAARRSRKARRSLRGAEEEVKTESENGRYLNHLTETEKGKQLNLAEELLR